MQCFCNVFRAETVMRIWRRTKSVQAGLDDEAWSRTTLSHLRTTGTSFSRSTRMLAPPGRGSP
eukprot:5285992-Pyramimonas_sp.AAC.1